jgi:hypothetical protein
LVELNSEGSILFLQDIYDQVVIKNIKIKDMSIKALVSKVKHAPSGKISTCCVFLCTNLAWQ